MATSDGTQQNVVANKARHLIFFEGEDLCFNYKTGQWSLISGYAGLAYFSINHPNRIIGLVRYSSGAAELEIQSTTIGVTQAATIETAEKDLNQGGRSVVDSVRPLFNGASATVRVGVRDDLTESVTYSTGTALNSRTDQAHFRGAANKPEGRYIRIEVQSSDFTTILGADVESYPSGQV